MSNPYEKFVSEFARLPEEAKAYPMGQFPPLPRPEISAGAPHALIFSPHPDDEVIIGGYAVRLLREARWNITNVAVTQGSKKERQSGRLEELKNCCQYVGFNLVQTAPNGLEKINPKTREQDPALWSQSVRAVAAILAKYQPKAILFPHEHDWNSTHIGTHFLVVDALRTLPADFTCYAVETEFWGQMASPNLMVEVRPEYVAQMITALTFHIGEVKRNPYHLSLPAWMMDNVRRGAELVGGQGGAAPDFPYATLYRLRKWQGGKLENLYAGGRVLTAKDSPVSLLGT